MPISEARVATAHGSRYLQQLCKHWSHKFTVDFTAEKGMIDFGDGRACALGADAAGLVLRATVPEGGDAFYLVDHSTFTYLVAPEVGFLDFFGSDETPEAMAESVQCFVERL